MDAEKWELGIGHGINQVPDEVLPVRFEFVVFATEWNDASLPRVSGSLTDAVGIQSGTIDQPIGLKTARGCFHFPRFRISIELSDFRAGHDLTAALEDFIFERLCDGRVIDNAFLGHMQSSDSADVGFDCSHLVRFKPTQPGQPVLLAALVQESEARDFSGVGCDYKFAADFVRHFVRPAKLGHLANAFYGQLRFCGAGFVIQTTMQDAAVVAGLMLAEGGFFFQQGDGRGGECLKMFVGGGKADEAAADDDELLCVEVGHREKLLVKGEAGQRDAPAGFKSNPIQTRPNVDILAIHGAVKMSGLLPCY